MHTQIAVMFMVASYRFNLVRTSKMARVSQSLSDDLERQFDTQENCDVFFEVDEYTIGVHKFMLQARNEVLYNTVKSWRSGDKPILIEDMDYDSFETLLRYIYTDEILLTHENVLIFLNASTHFKMPQLEKLCVDHIGDTLYANNVCIFMNEAVQLKSTALQDICMEIFSQQTDVVLEDKSFLEISQPALSVLLDAEEINVLEIELFGDLKRWMTHRCHQLILPVTGMNMRYVLGDAFYKIRFPTMTVQDFANSVTTIKGLLTDTEMAQIFQMMTVFDTSNINCHFPNKFRCQGNTYYTPFNNMAQLFESQAIYNSVGKQYYDIKSWLKYVAAISNGGLIKGAPLRIILQCCADLANSSGTIKIASSDNQNIRKEIKDDFIAWEDVASTENISNILTNYQHLRSKLDKICNWH